MYLDKLFFVGILKTIYEKNKNSRRIITNKNETNIIKTQQNQLYEFNLILIETYFMSNSFHEAFTIVNSIKDNLFFSISRQTTVRRGL